MSFCRRGECNDPDHFAKIVFQLIAVLCLQIAADFLAVIGG